MSHVIFPVFASRTLRVATLRTATRDIDKVTNVERVPTPGDSYQYRLDVEGVVEEVPASVWTLALGERKR